MSEEIEGGQSLEMGRHEIDGAYAHVYCSIMLEPHEAIDAEEPHVTLFWGICPSDRVHDVVDALSKEMEHVFAMLRREHQDHLMLLEPEVHTFDTPEGDVFYLRPGLNERVWLHMLHRMLCLAAGPWHELTQIEYNPHVTVRSATSSLEGPTKFTIHGAHVEVADIVDRQTAGEVKKAIVGHEAYNAITGAEFGPYERVPIIKLAPPLKLDNEQAIEILREVLQEFMDTLPLLSRDPNARMKIEARRALLATLFPPRVAPIPVVRSTDYWAQ